MTSRAGERHHLSWCVSDLPERSGCPVWSVHEVSTIAKALFQASLFMTRPRPNFETNGEFNGHKRAGESREPQGYEMCDMSTKALQFISLVPAPLLPI